MAALLIGGGKDRCACLFVLPAAPILKDPCVWRCNLLIYWIMFAVPACAAIGASTRPQSVVGRLRFSWLLIFLGVVLLVGLRHQVGGDWFNYENHYKDVRSYKLSTALLKGDPGYYLILWISAKLDLGLHGANLFFSLFFSLGVISFCRCQPRPWLALAVAVPYLVIVIGMGYTRQGVAIGIGMLGLVALANQKNWQFVMWIAIAATFHKSAVLLVPLAVLATPRGRVWTGLWVGITAAVLYWVLLADSVDALVTNYVDAEYKSEGAAIRIAMNLLPAVLVLFFRNRFTWRSPDERNLWCLMALIAVASAGWLAVSSASTAIDRVALYLIPLQIFLFTRLPDVFGRRRNVRVWTVAVVAYYALVQFVWIFFAAHSESWLPYQFYPLVVLSN